MYGSVVEKNTKMREVEIIGQVERECFVLVDSLNLPELEIF